MSTAASVALVDEPNLTSERRLALALQRAGFWRSLRSAHRRAKCEPAEFRVLIKPDLSGFAALSPAATDPRLVECLVDLLHDAKYPNVVVSASADSSAVWAENRSVLALADLSGYRFSTPKGRAYDVRDLSEEQLPAPFSPGDLLAGSTLSSVWLDADFRIVFAKNKTDTLEGYALCLESLLGALPLVDKDYYYRLRQSAGEVIAELLRATPVHFAIIDAVVSSHGSGGARAPQSINTNCIIAASNVQLADYFGALKMGIDPAVSRTYSALSVRMPMTSKYTVHGELRIHPGWRNTNAILMDSTRKRDASVFAQRLTAPWLQVLDPTMFPLKRPVDARINANLAPFFGNLDDDPSARSTLVLANYAIAASTRILEMYRTIFDKDALRHANVSLGMDLGAFTAEDYEAIYPELAALESLLVNLPEQAEGLQWRYVDESVVFRYTRTIAVDFDYFVSKVDVARTIQYLNDYIGGVIVPVKHDSQGRVVRQAERNVYLPQPNYVALADGKPIDVSKLETVHYLDGIHRMCWKTMKSENGSAVHDDGIVTFSQPNSTRARGASSTGVGSTGQTLVTIVGKQLFVLPPFWQAMSLELNPQFKAELVTQSYKTFFDRSLSNLEALLEDRDGRIGRAWHEPKSAGDHEPPPMQFAERMGSRAVSWAKDQFAKPNVGGGSFVADAGLPAMGDADGFVHFTATPVQLSASAQIAQSAAPRSQTAGPLFKTGSVDSLLKFWMGLGDAINRDFGGGTPK